MAFSIPIDYIPKMYVVQLCSHSHTKSIDHCTNLIIWYLWKPQDAMFTIQYDYKQSALHKGQNEWQIRKKHIQVRNNNAYECECLLYAQPGHFTEWVLDVLQSPAMGKARWFLEAVTDRKGSQSPQVGLAGALTFLSVHTTYSVWGQRVWSPVAINVIRGRVKEAPSRLVEYKMDKNVTLAHIFLTPVGFFLCILYWGIF